MSLIITLTGMSTSGKSTLAKALSSTNEFKEAVSATTRSMRPGEVDGTDYHFISEEMFDSYVANGVLLEHVKSHHAAYGVPAFEVGDILESGKCPVMVLEPIGVKAIHDVAIRQNFPVISIFLTADMNVIIDRFFSRIDAQRLNNVKIDFRKEAQRLHTMLTVERSWTSIWPWDMAISNIHIGNRMSNCIDELKKCKIEASRFTPVNSELKYPKCFPECLPVDELEGLIRKTMENEHSRGEFYKNAVSPLISKQSKIRYKDGFSSDQFLSI